MLKTLFAAAIIASATAAVAQSGGSTYQNGSNPPQRTAGQVAPNTVGTIEGSASANSSRRVQPRAARANGAAPNMKKRSVANRRRAPAPHRSEGQ